MPGKRCLIAIHFLHPEQQAKARSAGAWILIDDLQGAIAAHQLFQAGRRVLQFVFVVDESKVTIVVGNEGLVVPTTGNRELASIDLAGGEQIGLLRGLQQVVVQAQNHVGGAVLAFHSQAIE
ncbi:hypothetical protein D3C75_948420 [compost metagenome]